MTPAADLAAALRKYGKHMPRCSHETLANGECTCGLSEALAAFDALPQGGDVATDSVWIDHAGDVCPVPTGTLVRVRYRDGGLSPVVHASQEEPGPRWRDAESRFWKWRDESGHHSDIVAFQLSATPPRPAVTEAMECHGLDTPTRVRFYEHDFYPLLRWKGVRFDTSEAAYHWEKFDGVGNLAPLTQRAILNAPSAHEAFKIAERDRDQRRPDWDAVKVDIMRQLIAAKADQHEYVRRKLLATGTRELVEDSWRDDFWGWGPNETGQNMLGQLWMELRVALAQEGGEG